MAAGESVPCSAVACVVTGQKEAAAGKAASGHWLAGSSSVQMEDGCRAGHASRAKAAEPAAGTGHLGARGVRPPGEDLEGYCGKRRR